MPKQRIFRTPEIEAQFDAICNLARNKDAINLPQIIRTTGDVPGDDFNNIYFTSTVGSRHYTPIVALAMDGEYEAVEFLLKQYNYVGEDCYARKKMQALECYIYYEGHIEHINQLVHQKKVTPKQIATVYGSSDFFDRCNFNLGNNRQKRLLAFTDNENLRGLIVDQLNQYSIEYNNSVKNQLLNEAKSANQFIRSCHVDWSCRAWLPKYNVLFLEVIPHLIKNIPEAIVCIYMSFIVPFSANEILDFFKKQSEIPSRQSSWRIGCHALFLRKATSRLQDQQKDLFMSKSELKECLNYFSLQSLPDIKRLLRQEDDNISYKAICAALPQDGTKSRVIDAINKKFDEKLTAKVSELNH